MLMPKLMPVKAGAPGTVTLSKLRRRGAGTPLRPAPMLLLLAVPLLLLPLAMDTIPRAIALELNRADHDSEIVCNVVYDYGVSYGPSGDSTQLIRDAIADCRRRALAAGPSTRAVVLFPNHNRCSTARTEDAACDGQEDIEDGEGMIYVTGAINVTSNMTLRIEAGATLMGIARATLFHWPLVVQYAPFGDGTTPGWMPHEGGDNATWPNGTNKQGPSLSPLIGSEVGAENARLDGGGVIDGQGTFWWQSGFGDAGGYNGRSPGPGLPPYGSRAPRNIEPFLCKNFQIEGLTIRNPGDWNVHPFGCDGVVIRNVTIYSPRTRGNTDGTSALEHTSGTTKTRMSAEHSYMAPRSCLTFELFLSRRIRPRLLH